MGVALVSCKNKYNSLSVPFSEYFIDVLNSVIINTFIRYWREKLTQLSCELEGKHTCLSGKKIWGESPRIR